MKLRFLFLYLVVFQQISSTTADVWTVNVSNFNFNPVNLPNVYVGDTVKWQWLSGEHTSTAYEIPNGAPSWHSLIGEGNQTFIYIVSVPGHYHYICLPHSGMEGFFTASLIGITPIEGELPKTFKLNQNYPNPFNPVTDITFDVPFASHVKISVFNILGSEVEVLVNEQVNPGSYKVDWDAANFPSGAYFYKMDSGNYTEAKKMILIK